MSRRGSSLQRNKQHNLKITGKKQPEDNKYVNAGVYKLKYKWTDNTV
jgi:hypothetical protein